MICTARAFRSALVLLAAALAGAAARASSVEEPVLPPELQHAWEQARPSVVLIRSTDDEGLPGPMCTGFYVEERLIATSDVILQGGTLFHVERHDGITFQAEVVRGRSKGLGLVLLEAAEAGKPLPLANLSVERRGAKAAVLVCGWSADLTPRLREAEVTGLVGSGIARPSSLSVRVPPSCVGGPVLLPSGAVLGVGAPSWEGGVRPGFSAPLEPLRVAEAGRVRWLESWEPDAGIDPFSPQMRGSQPPGSRSTLAAKPRAPGDDRRETTAPRRPGGSGSRSSSGNRAMEILRSGRAARVESGRPSTARSSGGKTGLQPGGLSEDMQRNWPSARREASDQNRAMQALKERRTAGADREPNPSPGARTRTRTRSGNRAMQILRSRRPARVND